MRRRVVERFKEWLLNGSKRDGVRQLYVMRLGDRREWRLTDLAKGRAVGVELHALGEHGRHVLSKPRPAEVAVQCGSRPTSHH
jgi:hypothetical protein